MDELAARKEEAREALELAIADAAGYDIYAAADVTIAAQSRRHVPTGIAALAPPGTSLRVGPRAGSAYKHIDV